MRDTPAPDRSPVAPPRNAPYRANRFPRRVDGPPPNPDSPIATAAPVPFSPCDFATAFCPFSSLFSLVEIGIRFDPVTNGLRKLSNGVEGLLRSGPCHQSSDRQYRSLANRRARSASRIS